MAKTEKVTTKGKDGKYIQTLPAKKQDKKIADSKSPSKPLQGTKSVVPTKAQDNKKANIKPEAKKAIESKPKVEKKIIDTKVPVKSPAKPPTKKPDAKAIVGKANITPQKNLAAVKKVEPAKPVIVNKPVPKKVEAKKPEAKKEPVKKVEVKKVEAKKAEIKKPDIKKEPIKKVEVKKEEVKKPEIKKEQVKKVEVKVQTPKQIEQAVKIDKAIKSVEAEDKLLPKVKETKEVKVQVSKPKQSKATEEIKLPDEVKVPSDMPVVRYSDEDLNMFGSVISESRREALEELRMLKERLEDLTNYDFAEESMIYSMHMAEQGSEAMEKEKTYAQIQRIHEYIKKLDDALDRIKNKTYGICRVCNCLIAKERLLAVPITTLSASYKIHQKCPPDGIDIIEPVKEQKEPLGVEIG